MNTPFIPSTPASAPGDHPGAIYFRTREGLRAALIGMIGYLMVPDRHGGFRVATVYRPGDDPESWPASGSYSSVASVPDEAGFRAHVNEQAEHRRQLALLDRVEMAPGVTTPWGTAQVSRRYDKGIVCQSTAGHGGFQVDEAANLGVHLFYRNAGGWYEEDSQWAKLAVSFPNLFTDFERRCAHRTLRDDEPDAYEKVRGIVLAPGDSFTKDRRAFGSEHASDWIVTSAITSDHEPGFVECIAGRGGDRSAADVRRYLVPSDEYRVGRFGFVIDVARHRLYDGPSSFIGWANTRIREATS